MNSVSLPVVHPAFEKLKRSGSWLHFTAGILIVSHAVSHVNQQESSPLYFWCQMIIALDIFILVLAGGNMLRQMPFVNIFFRLVEVLFFFGIGLVLLFAGKWAGGIVHVGLSLVYSYLLYCERTIHSEELLSFHHTGITIPGIPDSKFLLWSSINHVEANYDSIHISTSLDKDFDFPLRKNLDFEELEQIHEFCRHYLKSS